MSKLKFFCGFQAWLFSSLMLAACGETATTVLSPANQNSETTNSVAPTPVPATTLLAISTAPPQNSATTTAPATSVATTFVINILSPTAMPAPTATSVPKVTSSNTLVSPAKTSPISNTTTTQPLPTVAPAVNNKPLFTVHIIGGLCIYGDCSTDITVNRDASFLKKDGGGAQKDGVLDKKLVSDLGAEIDRTDFNAIKAKKFVGTCPTAYDGQENIYTFYLPNNPESISSCQYALDGNAPLWTKIHQIIQLIDQA